MSKRMICYLESGTVHEVDAAAGRVRVKFHARDLISWWLPVNMRSVGVDKFYNLYNVGDPVTCLMDEYCESGIVIGGSYTDALPAPFDSKDKLGFIMEDGTSVIYDKAAHKLDVAIQGDANIGVTGNAAINVDGDVEAIVAGITKIICETIELGDGSMFWAVLFERLKAYIDTHVHMGNLGAPTSPPQTPMPENVRSTQVKVGA